ncbi:MAG: primosomal protein N' [Armatimonadota bacterium]|nr:primosomal protein N' [Armatimonadota bacterium]MDR7436772.1 primosomal protein N' [Armatimonadota bacterium]MDR7472719.1 primosomal protein N' [Armatimonadota bacterium]MDR7506990.1 primosomal protein N' [Armatimonadota bacterium]MDR7508851.1 primosomal protein N' [Armatimonadota bacterium]
MASPPFADVALNVPLRAGDRVWTFAVPESVRPHLRVGTAVWVPLGRAQALGFVVRFTSAAPARPRPIAAVEDRLPVLPEDLVALAWWMAERYVCSVGEAIAAMVPPPRAGLRRRSDPAPVYAPSGEPSSGDPPGVLPLLEAQGARVAVVGEEGRFDAYAAAVRATLDEGRGVIVLTPEVAQAERLAPWLARRAGVPAGLLTGAVGDGARWSLWRSLLAGHPRLVVGTRLAVFAPVPDLGLIVVEQEDDTSYKEEREPRYHARAVAEARADLAGARVVLGSPAPSLEVMAAVRQGRLAAVTAPGSERVPVVVADVRAEAAALGGLLSRRLYQALARTLPAGRATIFVPRRGYADFLLCHECGAVPRCPQCGVAYTYHRERVRPAPAVRLACHLCGRHEGVPEVCPACGGVQMRPHGVGTERVEAALRRLFSGVPVFRLDTESAPTEEAQQQIWSRFARRGGLLVGTQLLVRGVGHVRSAVVGAVGVDAALHLPDIRAAERTYQTLVRLRRLALEEMIVQTFHPTHPVWLALTQDDPDRFYRAELEARERFGYPPARPLINVLLSCPQAGAAREAAQVVADALAPAADVLGPSPAPGGRRRGRVRWQLLIKERDPARARRILADLLTSRRLPRAVAVTVDADPLDLF